jgi:uncharacterized protein involved in exopolysaccharide biosynthesis
MSSSNIRETLSSFSLLTPVVILLRRARLFAASFAILAVVFTAYGLWTRDFIATSIILPQTPVSAGSSRISGVAAQFGLSVGGSAGSTESVYLYATVIKSRQLLGDLGLSPLAIPSGDDTLRTTFVQLEGIEADSPEGVRRIATARLNEAIQVRPDFASNTIAMTVRASSPILAEVLSRRVLELLNEFNLLRKQSTSRSERTFAEQRLAAAREELIASERALQGFLESNRSFSQSPKLEFDARRLQRVVDQRQQVVLQLSQAYEQARLEEVRDTPVITVVDEPEGTGRAGRKLIVILLMSLFAAGVIAVFVVLIREYLEWERVDRPATFAELRAAARAALPSRWGRSGDV